MYQVAFHTNIFILTEIERRRMEKQGMVEEVCYPSTQEVKADRWLSVQGHPGNVRGSRSAWTTKEDPV